MPLTEDFVTGKNVVDTLGDTLGSIAGGLMDEEGMLGDGSDSTLGSDTVNGEGTDDIGVGDEKNDGKFIGKESHLFKIIAKFTKAL